MEKCGGGGGGGGGFLGKTDKSDKMTGGGRKLSTESGIFMDAWSVCVGRVRVRADRLTVSAKLSC